MNFNIYLKEILKGNYASAMGLECHSLTNTTPKKHCLSFYGSTLAKLAN